MQVIATAGHVDHGKSALVRALTGMEPDRWAEERRRGLTIDLGFAWMTLPDGQRLAFVDVPGHERFVPNMLAGVGPVPAVLVVVAADGGWMPQSAEHLAAIDAVGIRHGLLVVTRSDLADPGPATRQAADQIAATSLGRVESVAVSAVTGAGLPELRAALVRLMASLPVPDAAAPVRLWVDRSFSIRGSGTVVTGTLPAGTIRSGQELLLTPSMRPARIRGLESLNEPTASVSGVARVALNLRGVPADVPARGMALVDAGRWTMTKLADVRLAVPPVLRLPPDITVHIGSARILARLRLLGPLPDSGGTAIARLTLREPLPLHVGDRLLLRDPGSAGVTILGATVLDVAPPALARRGAAAAAGRELAAWPDVPAAADLLRRHGLLRASAVAAMGVVGSLPAPVTASGWLADPARWGELRRQLAEMVAAHARRDPLAIGLPPEAARAALRLPDRALVEALARLRAPETTPGDAPSRVRLDGGYLYLAEPHRPLQSQGSQPALPPEVMAGVRAVLADLASAPFLAPEAGRLRELGLDGRAIGAAARAGLLLRVAEQIVLAPGAEAEAARALAGLPQPFTTAEARQALGTTRRVAIPLLEHLDRAGITQRLPDDRRRLRLKKSGLGCIGGLCPVSAKARQTGGRMRVVPKRKEFIMTAVEDAPAASATATTGVPASEEEARELAMQWANEHAARLTERVRSSLAKKNGQSNGHIAPRIGGPITYDPNTGAPYLPFDVVETSPITFGGPPPYAPSKIVPAGSFSYLIAYIYTNPASDAAAGWYNSASVQCGARPWRMTLDLTNLTTGTTSNLVQNGVFGSPADVITPVFFLLPTAGPALGADPWLIEANVTVYVDIPAQPFAAFGTNFYDIDNDPGGLPFYPPIPAEPAGWRFDLPNRYLIFP
jgi:selenocysteine-specific elongation factor